MRTIRHSVQCAISLPQRKHASIRHCSRELLYTLFMLESVISLLLLMASGSASTTLQSLAPAIFGDVKEVVDYLQNNVF